MDGIITMAVNWLEGNRKTSKESTEIHEHIIESLLKEIKRIEEINLKNREDMQTLSREKGEAIRLATAEECAVICETADYLVRNYGCAREIRKKFGLKS
ncbi:MAG: hypothetical protein PHN84_07585 [Desulfuromonadaceae bacterium]|nr:hypothetical protein [Desulfuromonadaceae bacterium]MDD2854954.1 hypothetical protein [Desulfuromonadaceae bacterium]